MADQESGNAATQIPPTAATPAGGVETRERQDFPDLSDGAIATVLEQQATDVAQPTPEQQVADAAAGAATGGTTDVDPLTGQGATLTPAGDAQGGEVDRIVQLADGSWLIDGMHKGATIQEAALKASDAVKDRQRRITELSHYEDAFNAGDDQPEFQQQPDPIGFNPALTGPGDSPAARIMAADSIRNSVRNNPLGNGRVAAEQAIMLDVPGLLEEVLEEWGAVNPYAAAAFQGEVQQAQAWLAQQAEVHQSQQIAHQQTQAAAAANASYNAASEQFEQKYPNWRQWDGPMKDALMSPAGRQQLERANGSFDGFLGAFEWALGRAVLSAPAQLVQPAVPVAGPAGAFGQPGAPVQQQGVNPVQQQQDAVDQQRTIAGLTAGTASDVDVIVRGNTSNKPEDANTDQVKADIIGELGGMRTSR